MPTPLWLLERERALGGGCYLWRLGRFYVLHIVFLAVSKFMIANDWVFNCILNTLEKKISALSWGIRIIGLQVFSLIIWNQIYRSHKGRGLNIQRLNVVHRA